jgi:hypothetical protein
MLKLATGKPLGKNLISGSLPTLPTRMTLLMLFAMMSFYLCKAEE